jgi:hypothetical protein
VVDNILRRDHLTAEVASVETADRVLAALHTVEFEVDFAVVGVEGDAEVDDDAVFLVAFATDVFLELLLPAGWIVC